MSSTEEETQDLLVEPASTFALGSSSNNTSAIKLTRLSNNQAEKTNTFLKRLSEFLKIRIFGYRNEFERFVLETEPNDCSLVAKYATVVDVDLSSQSSISVDELTLYSMHIAHPLVNFMRNEANQSIPENLDISKELKESPILVFIHGLGGQMSQFEPLMGLLSQCSEIISLDLPGFGNSKVKFEADWNMVSVITPEEKSKISSSIAKMTWEDFQTDNIVNIIYEFIKQNIPEDKKIVLIGHSMGTILSIKLAKKLPKHKVEGLILLSPPSLIDDVVIQEKSKKRGISTLQFFSYFPFLLDSFRVWDRLPGLESKSVSRQLSNNSNVYTKLRQFRWNMDINTTIILKYIHGFKNARYSDLIAAISQFNDNPFDSKPYEKTLLIGGSEDKVTSVQIVKQVDQFLTSFLKKKVSSAITIQNAGHSLLLAKPEFISGMVLNHIESKFPERLHLSPAWVLKVKAKISGDKWGMKNELKWSKLQPVSSNITRDAAGGIETAPLLGMKTLREGDVTHSPKILEHLYYGSTIDLSARKIIAIIDISADIPPYSPKSFQHIKYYKCATVSKVVPDKVAIRRFNQLVDDILANNTSSMPLIAVHCHYGFNRTGFLICCYLIERLGWSVQEAVEGFKVAKPPGIKHPHFIDALYVRYES